VLTAGGHNPIYVTASQATDVEFLSALDMLIISRRAGTPEIKTYVQNGGSLITEWSATDWALNEGDLLSADAQIGFSPSTFIATGTPITFTAAGLAAGLGNGLASTFSDEGSTQFFWPISNLDPAIEVLATREGGEPVILFGESGAGQVLIMAHDWNDRSYDPTDGIVLNEQLLLNAVTFLTSDVATVPLPASLPLLLGGLLMFAFPWRRRQG
jgi:hypothetical protein